MSKQHHTTEEIRQKIWERIAAALDSAEMDQIEFNIRTETERVPNYDLGVWEHRMTGWKSFTLRWKEPTE